MSDPKTNSSQKSLENHVSLGAVVLFSIFSFGSAYISFFFWVLGIGIPDLTHNLMGLGFIAINVICFANGIRHLKRGMNPAAIFSAILAAPACLVAVFVLGIASIIY